MSSFSFPDVNVWLALASSEHVHSGVARRWWSAEEGRIGFCRLSQMGFLRLLTTAAAMGGKPLGMEEAWRLYDRFFEDERVAFVPEPSDVDTFFRKVSSRRHASPKLWVDAWLLGFTRACAGRLVTFDRALGSRGAYCLLE